jgi:hypothetical protein
MSEYKEKIVDAITGEVTWRDYSAEEVLQIENNLQQIAAEQAEAAAKAAEKAALLERLGITADEAQLLLGGN